MLGGSDRGLCVRNGTGCSSTRRPYKSLTIQLAGAPDGRRLRLLFEAPLSFPWVEGCRRHGVVVARVPWARHDSRFTKDFEEQCAWLAVHVSKTKNVLARRCPTATVCLDPFHVVSWATNALDQVRREVWNEARRSGQTSLARELKGARYALWKNPEDLTRRQTRKLSDIARINKPLYRAYLLKEQLREVFRLPFQAAVALLEPLPGRL